MNMHGSSTNVLGAEREVEIFHCIARAAPTTAHGNFDNVREIPLD